MAGLIKNKIKIIPLEKRLMLDASLAGIISSTVLAEDITNASADFIDNDVTISGSTTDFNGDDLTISTTGGAEDQLTINNEGTGAGQISISGTDISYEGVIIGSLTSDGVNGADLTVSLNANATQAGIERLIENVKYQNISDTPTTSRTVTVALGAYFSEDVSITVVAQNDDLVLAANNGLTVAEGASTLITTADLNVTDVDDANADLVFTVTSTVSVGRLELTTNTGVAITSFTMDDIVNNRVQYVHNDTETFADSFDFTVTDGDTTLAEDTFDITITPVNDPLSLTTNSGVTVFENFSTSIGGDITQFGTELLRYTSTGTYGTWDGTVDNGNVQYRLVFTTPGVNPTEGPPGDVLFESGGAGVGLGLYLNSDMELDFYAGAAAATPRLSSDALAAGTQYAVIVEIDQTTDQIRLHYQQESSHDWFRFGRLAEKTLDGYSSTDHSGSDGAGVGRASSSGGKGGYNGPSTGNIGTFTGSIDSDLVITRFPADSGMLNTQLVALDTDTLTTNIIYTITDDVDNGTLYRSGVALGLGDSFSQADLDLNRITYTSTGGSPESFDFSVSDGTTTIAGQTFTITIDTSNTAPEILTSTTIYEEDFEGGTTGWNNNTTTSDTTLSEFWGRFGRSIHVGGDQELFQTFTTSGTQDYIVVEFDFYELDTWDNEYFYIFVNDTNILGNTHRYQVNTFDREASGSNGNVSWNVQETTEDLGYIAFNGGQRDQTYRYTLVIENADPTLKLGFGSSLNSTNLNDESFGIDNITITELRRTAGSAQEFNIAEDIGNGDVVGTVQAVEDNIGQSITYSQTGGTGNALFAIDANTGEITVTDNSGFDFEVGPNSYTLDILVTDGFLTDTQTITVNLVDVMENTRPNINAHTFSIGEDAAVNDDVGIVTSTDPEGDTVTYQIIGGNDGNAFKINATTGLIEVRTAGVLDFDSDNRYDLRIRAWDDNDLRMFHDRTIVINITDVDEAPSLDIEYVIESQNTGVIYSVDTGNFYKVITTDKTYAQALADAPSEMLNGVAGHLVTITSQAEYNFIRDFASPSHVRIALSDGGEEGKWIWTAGPEAGTQITQGNVDAVGFFNNWLGAEPNSGINNNSALFHSNGWWYDNWEGAYDSVVEWEGGDIINNSFYNVNHTSPDASDVNVGDSVGFIKGLDPEGDAIDFSIEGGNGDGIFEIDTVTGEIRILDTTNLNATVQDTYVLTIRATENAGTKFDEIDITIKFNDDFSISANNPLNVNESSSAVLTTAELNISDLDGVAANTRFFANVLPVNGQLEHSTNPGFQISSFTLDDLQNGRISYVHDGTETTTDSFTFEVTDGGRVLTAQTFNINIVAVNDAPTVPVNTGAPITEGGSTTITNVMLDSLDIDDGAADLTYTASNYANGHIEVGGVVQNTFTQADIDNGDVVFVHDGGEGATRFDFSLADGGEDMAAPATGTFNFVVTPVNDSPVLTTNTGASVVEGATVNITNAMLNGTDPDDSGTGLTYTLSNILNGQVELSTSPNTPIISFTQADLNAGRVVFRHDGNESNARFDVTIEDGGEDSATTDTETFNLTRIPVNDAVSVTTNLGSSVNQNSLVVLNRAVLETTDPDDNPAGITYTVTGTTSGHVAFLADPTTPITTFTQADINNALVVFQHIGAPGVADFDFSVADGLEDSAVASTGTFALTVDNTNDAPTITTNTGPTVLEGSTTTITTAMLDSFDPDDFGTGLTWTVSNLVNGVVQVSGVTQNTFTQADLLAGIVTFVHDDTETLTGGFDVSLADGGEDMAAPDTDTFTLTITPVNEGPTLVVNDGSPNVINFNDYTVGVFDGSQDGANGRPATAVVSGDGSEITIGGNAWKKIDLSYAVTANTVLSFEFFADHSSEIAGIGFDDASGFGGGVQGYQLDGTQTWSGMDQSFNTYDTGDGWVRFDLPIGSDFTGAMTQMVFVLDNDDKAMGEIKFRNVNFYEADQVVDVDEGGTFNITTAHINSVDPDDSGVGLVYTVSNESNGEVRVSGVAASSFTQDDLDNNRVTFVHDGTDTANAGFDISLADGGEDSALADTGSFTLIVNPINDAPTIATNTGATMNEGANLTITSAMLNESDPDDDGAQLTYTASALSNGHIEVGGVTQNTFTQDDINQGRVVFVHDGSETIAASFNISLADGGEDTVSPDAGVFNITVTPVDDAPTVDTNSGATVAEGGTINFGRSLVNMNIGGTPSDLLVETINGESWILIGRGREGWEFDTDGQGSAANVVDGLGSTAAFDPVAYDDAFVNDILTALGQDLTNTDVRIKRAADITGDNYQEVRWTNASTPNWTWDLDGNQFTVDHSVYNSVLGAAAGPFTDDTRDTMVSTGNDYTRIWTFQWGGKNNTQGFGYGAGVSGVNNDDPNTYLWENTGENHATPYTEVYVKSNALINNPLLLETNDVDTVDSNLVYTITSGVANGVMTLNGVALGVNDTFTQEDLNNGLIEYKHDGSETLSDSFVFDISDGTTDITGQTFDITVTPVNDSPLITVNTGATGDEGGSIAITNTDLNVTDPDDDPANVTYTASALTNGHIEVGGVTQNTFTQADINNGDVAFIHDGSETVAASFNISLADGGEDGADADIETFNITITPVNDQIALTTNTGATFDEGASLTITTAMLNSTDVDDTPANRTYTASVLTNGHIEVGGVTQNTFTQADIDNGDVVFVHDDSQTTAASFDFSLADGLENGAVAVVDTFSMVINPVNDAPVVNATSVTVNEGGSTTIDLTTLINDPENAIDTNTDITILGSTLSSESVGNPLTGAGAQDGWRSIMIVDESQTYTNTTGEPVTINPTGFNFNAGSNATPVTPFIVLVNGDNDFTVLAVGDSATGFSTGDVNVGFSGADSSFTLQPGQTIAMGFLDANADGSGGNGAAVRYTNGGSEVWLTGGAGDGDSGSVAVNDSEADMQGGSVLNLTRTYQFNIDFDVEAPAPIGNVVYNAATGVVTYTHDGSETTADKIFFQVDDGTGPIIRAIDITITPVNDAPVINANVTSTLAEGGSIVLTNAQLSSSDVDNADGGLTYTLTALPAGVLENTNTSSVLGINDTFTQSDIDNGFIRYTHDGEEHTSQSFSFTLSDGSATLASANYAWNITPVNDTPIDIGLTNMIVSEDAGIGAWVGDLYTMDVDLPGDTFTYAIMSDPDSKFMILGNQLMLNAALDFESSALHSVTIRTTDNNGAFFDRTMDITVLDFNEFTFTPPPPVSGSTAINGDSIVIEEEEREYREGGSLIASSLYGDDFMQSNAFYGENGLGQILRARTTIEIREMTSGDIIENPDPVEQSAEGAQVTPTSEAEAEVAAEYTNIREMLEALKQFQDGEEENSEGEEAGDQGDGFHNLYDQFEDVLTYHEQRKEKLRQALLS